MEISKIEDSSNLNEDTRKEQREAKGRVTNRAFAPIKNVKENVTIDTESELFNLIYDSVHRNVSLHKHMSMRAAAIFYKRTVLHPRY